MTDFVTMIAVACGLIAGLPQIARMVRGRSSESQSALGWAIGAKGAAATTYVGVAHGAAPVVYAPSAAGAAVAVAGLGVTLYFGPSIFDARAGLARVGRVSRKIPRPY